jgi:hypothetical protein
MQAGQWGSVMSADTATGASPSHRWVQAGLVIVTAAELLDALSSVQSDYHLETDLLRFAQRLTTIKLALSPLLAGAALVRRVREYPLCDFRLGCAYADGLGPR